MKQPNLLFFCTDEQQAATMAAYGNNLIQTPNLNALARQSLVFDKAYCTSPICTASRSSIMTGLYPHANGCVENNIPLPSEIPSFAEMLSADYHTAYYGKWHLGDEIFKQHGFDDWRSIDDGYRQFYSSGRDQNERSSYHHFLIENGFQPADGEAFTRKEITQFPEEFSKPAYLAREACQFLDTIGDQPFALFVAFLEPHFPYYGPRDDQHPLDDIPLPKNFSAIPNEDNHNPLRQRLYHRGYYEDGWDGYDLKTEADWRRVIANYWGLCSQVDTYVGQILKSLAAHGLDENTMVAYTSDHGDQMGEHRILHKGVMFEESARIPLLLRLPGQDEERHITPPVSQIDLVPTLLDLMNQPIPAGLHGRSMRPLIENQLQTWDDVVVYWSGRDAKYVGVTDESTIPEYMLEIAPRDEIWAAFNEPIRTIVTSEGWKFCYRPRGESELYDLNQDPGEMVNLAMKPGSKSRIEEMIARIKMWQAHTLDTFVGGN
jgi:arylsulfatase A-like enzyme